MRDSVRIHERLDITDRVINYVMNCFYEFEKQIKSLQEEVSTLTEKISKEQA